MDTLHTVMRSIRGETKSEPKGRRDHLHVFREFLQQLDRASRRKPASRAAKPAKSKARRRR